MENKITYPSNDMRDYDVHETGHVELSGMTTEEYLAWEWQQIKKREDNGYNPKNEI